MKNSNKVGNDRDTWPLGGDGFLHTAPIGHYKVSLRLLKSISVDSRRQRVRKIAGSITGALERITVHVSTASTTTSESAMVTTSAGRE